MNCKCNWTDLVLALLIIILAIWPSFLGGNISQWIIVIAATLILIHSLMHPHSWSKGSSIKSKKRK